MKARVTITKSGAPKLTHLWVRKALGATSNGHLRAGAITLACSLGRSGITRLKREGDGKSPAGRFALKGGFIQPERLKGAGRAPGLVPARANLGWCDDPGSGNYNRPIKLPNPAGHEIIRRSDGLYDVVIVLDYNLHPRKRGAGSAIFFHLTRAPGEPTAGCVAIDRQAMRRLLPRLSKKTVMVIV